MRGGSGKPLAAVNFSECLEGFLTLASGYGARARIRTLREFSGAAGGIEHEGFHAWNHSTGWLVVSVRRRLKVAGLIGCDIAF